MTITLPEAPDWIRSLDCHLAQGEVKLSEWMEANIVLPASKGTLRPGPLRLEDWQRAPYDAMLDPSVRYLSFMFFGQSGKSQGTMARIAYACLERAQTPLFAAPTQDMLKRVIEDKFDPMLQTIPRLAQMIRLNKNGSAYFRDGLYRVDGMKAVEHATARAPGKLKSFTTPLVIADELDEFLAFTRDSTGPRDMLLQRGEQTIAPLVIVSSTPGTEGDSLIETDFKNSDARERFVRCVYCSEVYLFEFDQAHQFDGAWRLYCPSCALEITEEDRQWMITDAGGAYWASTNPNATPGFVGFHVNQFHSLTRSINDTMKTYTPDNIQGFMTQRMAVPYRRDDIAPLDEDEITRLHAPVFEEPLLARIIAVDSQSGRNARFEYSVVDFHGDYLQPLPYIRGHYRIDVIEENWRQATLDLLNAATKERFDVMMVDVGLNIGGDMVKNLLRTVMRSGFQRNRIKALKGIGQPDDRKWDTKELITGERRFGDGKPYDRTLSVDSNVTKIWVVKELREGVTRLNLDTSQFPDGYYAQLASEWLERYPTAGGVERRRWRLKPHQRNEALDVLVYAYAGLIYLGAGYKTIVERRLDPEKIRGLMGLNA